MEHFANYDRRLEPPDDDHIGMCIICGAEQDIDDMHLVFDGWLCHECEATARDVMEDEDCEE